MNYRFLLERPIEGPSPLRERRYARLTGHLGMYWSVRIARDLGLSEDRVGLVRRLARQGSGRPLAGLPATRGIVDSKCVSIVQTVAHFVQLIEPLDGDPATPNAALRELCGNPERFPSDIVETFARQFRGAPAALAGRGVA